MAVLISSHPGRSVFSCHQLGAAFVAVFAVIFLAVGPWARAQPVPTREYQIKAVFLFNFAQFVSWPPDAFIDPQAPVIIGVLGQDPFTQALDEAVRGEKVNDRSLVVRRYERVEEIKDCHVLFISDSETARLEQIFAALKGRPILTVGDAEGFTQQGGMIRFIMENNRIRFRINLEPAKAARLTISSKLLRPAEIVSPTKG